MSLFNSFKKATDLGWEESREAFFKAIKNGDIKTVKEIHARYSDSLSWINKNRGVLKTAVRAKNLEMFKTLLDLGANMYEPVHCPQYPHKSVPILIELAVDKKTAFVIALLERNVDVRREGRWETTYKNYDGDVFYFIKMFKAPDMVNVLNNRQEFRAQYLAKNNKIESEKRVQISYPNHSLDTTVESQLQNLTNSQSSQTKKIEKLEAENRSLKDQVKQLEEKVSTLVSRLDELTTVETGAIIKHRKNTP